MNVQSNLCNLNFIGNCKTAQITIYGSICFVRIPLKKHNGLVQKRLCYSTDTASIYYTWLLSSYRKESSCNDKSSLMSWQCFLSMY